MSASRSTSILVWEFLTGGGLFEADLADSAALRAEGAAMVGALVEDLSSVDGVAVHWLHDDRSAAEAPVARCRAHRSYCVTSQQQFVETFDRLAAECDACFLIAPETTGILLRWTLRVEEQKGRLLSAPTALVSIASDKWRTNQQLRAAGVPVPAARPADESGVVEWAERIGRGGRTERGFVIKPRDGAGAHGLRRWRVHEHFSAGANDVVEEFVAGDPVGVLAVCLDGEITVLSPTRQIIDPATFEYRGGIAPLEGDARRRRAERLARRALDAFPVASGFVGVDLVLGEAEDGSDDAVIEVNPRLTTSYVGLRAISRINLARALLDPAVRALLPDAFGGPPIRFAPDGRIEAARGST